MRADLHIREDGSGSRAPAEEVGRRHERLPPVVVAPLHGVHERPKMSYRTMVQPNLCSTPLISRHYS